MSVFLDNKHMDFGNILDRWLASNPVCDKDTAPPPLSPRAAGARRRRLLRKKPEAVIDLHGMVQDDAWSALELFFDDCRSQGLEKVLVVHGKGNHSPGEGLLKKLAARFIEQCPFAGENGPGSAGLGGTGATWVLLKDPAPGPGLHEKTG